MKVYRVEHSEFGCGPYRTAYLFDYATEQRISGAVMHTQFDGEHPTPRRDGLGDIEDDEHCGFASLEALREWFDAGTMETLRELGYVVRTYYANLRDVRVGGKQVVFRRHRARRLAEVLV